MKALWISDQVVLSYVLYMCRKTKKVAAKIAKGLNSLFPQVSVLHLARGKARFYGPQLSYQLFPSTYGNTTSTGTGNHIRRIGGVGCLTIIGRFFSRFCFLWENSNGKFRIENSGVFAWIICCLLLQMPLLVLFCLFQVLLRGMSVFFWRNRRSTSFSHQEKLTDIFVIWNFWLLLKHANFPKNKVDFFVGFPRGRTPILYQPFN